MDFYAYLLRCADGSYYAGHTDDLETRVAQHQMGEIPGYTQTRRPVELVWSQSLPSREEALAAEKQIKGWSRAKKEALIADDWQMVRSLASRSTLRAASSPSSAAPQGERPSGGVTSTRPTVSPPPTVRAAEGLSARTCGAGRIAPPPTVRPEEGLSPAKARLEGPPIKCRPPAIVLVRPQLGENIGKAARAMLNFGLTDLRLVNPRDGWPNPAAGPAASGADVVLEKARIFDSVADAVADCAHVYATTVRKRGLVVPVVTPDVAARQIHARAEPSAILFGAERSGLETEEAAIAGTIITVPINPEFRSLNLAQAVVLLAYEWSKHVEMLVPTEGEEREPTATQQQLEGLIRQLDAALDAVGYFYPEDRAPATRITMRTILTRAGWSNREVQALRGMIRALTHPRQRGRARTEG